MADEFGFSPIVGVKRRGDYGYEEDLQAAGNVAKPQQPADFTPIADEERTYWEKPARLEYFNNIILANEKNPNWVKPEGLDTEAVKAAYSYMSFKNKGKPVSEWTPIDNDDPQAVEFLRKIPTPPVELMPYGDRTEYEAKLMDVNSKFETSAKPLEEVGDWDELEWSRQVMLTLTGAGEDTMMKDRPEITRIPATVVQGVMGGLGVGMGALAITKNPYVGLGAFLAGAGVSAYQAYTGERIPVVSDAMDKFNIPARALESQIGQLYLKMTPEQRIQAILENGLDPIRLFFGGRPSAEFVAGEKAYEAAPPVVMNGLLYALDGIYNFGSDVTGVFGGGWKKVSQDWAEEGYRWDIHKGSNDPVKIAGMYGDEAINDYYQRILKASDEDFDKVSAEIAQDAYDRFGYSGVINDLAGQTVLDPMNIAPLLEGFGVKKIGKILKSEHLAEVAGRMQGNPLIDILPFGVQQLTEALVRGKPGSGDWKPFGVDLGLFGRKESSRGLIQIVNEYGEEIRRGVSPASVKPIQIDQLTWLDRMVAGLDENGRIKDFIPFKPSGNPFKDFFGRLKSLDPNAQAINFVSNFEDNLQILGKDSGENMDQFDADLHKIASTGDPESVRQVVDQFDYATATDAEKLDWERRNAMLHSPMAATIGPALKFALGVVDKLDLIMQWKATQYLRDALLTMSNQYGAQAGKFLEDMGKNPNDVFQKLNSTPEGQAYLQSVKVTDANSLKKFFELYTGENKFVWHPDALKAIYINKLLDALGDYLVKEYGIKPQGTVMRFVGAMKDVQSLLVLGINPGYFINNVMNNMITRAAQGVWGFIPDSQINDVMKRMGLSELSRLKEGVGAAGEGIEAGGLEAIRRASTAKGKIEDFRKTVRSVTKTVGIFQKWSGAFEKSESYKAYTLGLLDMWGKVWKEGTGFDRLPPLIEKQMDAIQPGLKEAYYEAVRAGFNMDEIRENMFKDLLSPTVKGVLDEAVTNIDPQYGEELKTAIVQLGIETELTNALGNARTAQDVNAAIDTVMKKLRDVVHARQVDLLKNIGPEIEAQMKSEGTVVALEQFMRLQQMITHDYLAHFKEWFDLFDAYKNQDRGTRSLAVAELQNRQFKAYQDLHAHEVAVYNAIIKAMGIESPEAQGFVENITKLGQLSDDFYSEKNRMHQELFASGLKGKDFEKEQKIFNDRTMAMYKKYNADKVAVMNSMNTQFSGMLLKYTGDKLLADLALNWRKKIMELELIRQSAMESMFKQLGQEKLKGESRSRVWQLFIQDVYTPRVREIEALEIAGANALKSRPDRPIDFGAKPAAEKPAATTEATDAKQKLVDEGGESVVSAEKLSDEEAQAKADTLDNQDESVPEQQAEPVIDNTPGSPATITAIVDLAKNAMQDIKLNPDGTMMESSVKHIVATVNKYIPEIKTKSKPDGTVEPYTSIDQIPLDQAEIAYANRTNERLMVREKAAAQALLNAERIAELHDENLRKAEISSMGKRARADIETFFQEAFDASPLQMRAMMMLVDRVADGWARRNGFAVGESSRDAWYATHIDQVINVDDPGQLKGLQQIDDIDNYQSLGQYEETLSEQFKNIRNMYAGQLISYDAVNNIFSSRQVNWDDDQIFRQMRTWDKRELSIGYMAMVRNSKIDGTDQAKRIYRRLKADGIEASPEDIRIGLIIAGVDPEQLKLNQDRRGSVDFNKDGAAIIRAHKSKDFSTMVHEVFHVFSRDLSDSDITSLIKWSGASITLDQYKQIEHIWQATPIGKWSDAEKAMWKEYEKVQEKFAIGGERYLAEGVSPVPELRPLFKKFQDFLLDIYVNLRHLLGIEKTNADGKTVYDIDIHTEIDGIRIDTIYDKLLSDGETGKRRFDDIVEFESKKKNKTVGLNEDQRQFIAKKNAIENLLGHFESLEEAKAKINEMLAIENDTLEKQLYASPIGEVDAYTLLDAVNEIDGNDLLDIWKNKDRTPAVYGNQVYSVYSADTSTSLPFKYAVVELDDLVPDIVFRNQTTAAPNEKFSNNVRQDRQRTSNTSVDQIIKMATPSTLRSDGMKPELLLDHSIYLNSGAPMIDANQEIGAGFGRISALKYAVEFGAKDANGNSGYDIYKQELPRFAAQYGISPDDYAGMKHPVLVRIIDAPIDDKLDEFFFNSNKLASLGHSEAEIAIRDAGLISEEMLANWKVTEDNIFEVLRKKKQDIFIQKFAEQLPANERAELANESVLGKKAIDRIVYAIVAKTFPQKADRIIGFLTDANFNSKNALNGIMLALPMLAKIEANISIGRLHPDISISGALYKALDTLIGMRQERFSLEKWLKQESFFPSPEEELNKFLVSMLASSKPKTVQTFLNNYVSLAMKEPDMRQTAFFDQTYRPMSAILEEAKTLTNEVVKDVKVILEDMEKLDAEEVKENAVPAEQPKAMEKAKAREKLSEQFNPLPDVDIKPEKPKKVPTSPKEMADQTRVDRAMNNINQGKAVSLEDLDLVLENTPDPENPDAPIDFADIGMTLGQPADIGSGTYDTNDAAIVFRQDAPGAQIYATDKAYKRPPITHQLRSDVLSVLKKDIGQDIDAASIISAYDSGKRAFVLSNGTGMGKTWVGAGVIAEMKPRKAVIIAPNKQIADTWMQALRDFGIEATGNLSDTSKSGPVGDGIYWDTYHNVGLKTKDGVQYGSDFDLILYDESHKLKNYGKKENDNAEANVNLYRNSPKAKVLFLSATPYQDLDEMKYLAPLGLWGKNESDYETFLIDHGYKQRINTFDNSVVWEKGRENVKELLNVRRALVESGVFSQRELAMDKNLQNSFPIVRLGEYEETYRQIDGAFSSVIDGMMPGKYRNTISAQRTLALRRVMELAKIKAAVPLAKAKLAEGKQVALFVNFKGEFKAPDLKGAPELSKRIAWIYSSLSENGMIENLVEELGGTAKVAQIFGGRQDKLIDADIRAYNNGTKKIAVVTQAKGGTGLSLHDKAGDAPRVQINITLPWSAQDFTQVAGRSYRYGTQSDVEQYWFRADTSKEQSISSVIAGRMRAMGAVVRGIHSDSSTESLAAFDGGVLENDYFRDLYLKRKKQEAGIGRGIQATVIDPFEMDNGRVARAMIYYNGEQVAYVPNGLKVTEVHNSQSGKKFQVLGYSVDDDTKTVIYLPDENRIQLIDAKKPTLGQPAQKKRVTGFEDVFQSSFLEPMKPEEGLPLFTGKPIEPELPTAKPSPIDIGVPKGQTQLMDFLPNPQDYSPQFDLNATMPRGNQVKMYFKNANNQFELIVADANDFEKINSILDDHKNAKEAAYQIVTIAGKYVEGGKNMSRLRMTASEARRMKQGQGSLFDKPALGQPEDDAQRMSEMPAPPLGPISSGKAPTSIWDAEVLNEAYYDQIQNALSQFGEDYKKRLLQKSPGMKKLPPELVGEVEKWLGRVNTQMTSAKLIASRYGEMQRDQALLNYTWRYGVDNYVNMSFPYSFWYLRTMMRWGERMIDKPAWFSMYARLKEAQDKIETKGLPDRFKGLIRAYAPWLPEWAGSNLFYDPMQQMFPLSVYTNLGKGMEYEMSSVERATKQNLLNMVDDGKITREQYDAALLNTQDPLYVQAYEEAQKQSELSNPVGLASMMMQPGMWITTPYEISKGTPERISVLPLTRSSRAFGTALKDTPLEAVGNIIELMGAGPETAIRKKTGLSPYGRWGDYYIDRELANLVADGAYSPTDAMIAMIERKGEAYEAAEMRVKTQEMYKVPMATALNTVMSAVSGKQSASAIAPSLYFSVMPFGIFPEGEMKQRGLYSEYSKAWGMMKSGDLKAINNFFEEHPEYKVRLAVNKEPGERLKQLLIDQIWERWNAIPSGDKNLVADGLGDVFQSNFLNTATHDYETIDVPTLAYWAQSLGASVPETEQSKKLPKYQMPKIETYSPTLSKAIVAYKDEKNRLFPMIDTMQNAYFSTPKSQQQAMLASLPQIKKYWDWKKLYEKEHPELKVYFDKNREEAKEAKKPQLEKVPYDLKNMNSKLSPEEMQKFDPTLVKIIVANVNLRQELGDGAVAQLRNIWTDLGEPEGTLSDWYRKVVTPTFKG